MVRINRDELRTHVLLAFERRKIGVENLEILADGSNGRWRIGPAMIQSPADPSISAVIEEIEAELSALYELDGFG